MEKVSERIIEGIESKGITVLRSESGRKYSTFKSGGFIDYVILPENENQLIQTLDALSGYKFHLIGAGSNSLISDNGLNCVVCTKRLKGYSLTGDVLKVSAGERLSVLALYTAKEGKSGLEFAVGIPATVGGAIVMNAGAHGKEIKDVLQKIRVYEQGEIKEYSPADLKMSYRYSNLSGAIVLSCVMRLIPSDASKCLKRIEDNLLYRRETQPSLPSLGSVFKRTGEKSPWEYVQGAGLKGVRIGYAEVSGKHCNFIVNTAGATSRDYLRLTDLIIEKVYEKYGVCLQPEIKFIKD